MYYILCKVLLHVLMVYEKFYQTLRLHMSLWYQSKLSRLSSNSMLHYWILYFFWKVIASCGLQRKKTLFLDIVQKLNTAPLEPNWIYFHLRNLAVHLPSQQTHFCDNLSTLHMMVIPVFHAYSERIERDYHYMRECVALGLLRT